MLVTFPLRATLLGCALAAALTGGCNAKVVSSATTTGAAHAGGGSGSAHAEAGAGGAHAAGGAGGATASGGAGGSAGHAGAGGATATCPKAMPHAGDDPVSYRSGDLCPVDGLDCAYETPEGCPLRVACSSWCGDDCGVGDPRWVLVAAASEGDACAKEGLLCSFNWMRQAGIDGTYVATTTVRCESSKWHVVAEDLCDPSCTDPGCGTCTITEALPGMACGACWATDALCDYTVDTPCGPVAGHASCKGGTWAIDAPACP